MIERFFSPDRKRLHKIVAQSARYLNEFSIQIAPIPEVEVIIRTHDNLATLQHDNRARPSYNFRTGILSCPSNKLSATDSDHPLEPVILEELGHACVAQKRPDIRREIINLVNEDTGITTTDADRFVRIHLWNEGVANVFHRMIGKSWCTQHATQGAVDALHISEIYEYDDRLRLKRAFCLNESERQEVDQIALSKTDEETRALEQSVCLEDIKLIPHIVATLSDLENFRAGRDISELHHVIDELDKISYRSGYVFVKRVVDYLQTEHQYELAEAINWVIANGPMDKVDELKDPLSWVKRKLSENIIIDN